MGCLSLELAVDRAGAEALSEALLEAGAQSVIIDDPDLSPARLTALFGEAQDPGRALAAALEQCGADPNTGFAVHRVEDEDWVRRSQAQFAPLRLGRLWIGASWHQAPADARVIVRIDPGLAFGTGSHATTRLVLRFLDRTIAGGESVLDYGCGSGILAVAAAKLGAGRVDAVDIDASAVAVTRANALANGVVLDCAQPDELEPRRYQCIVANILAQPLIALAPLLSQRAAKGTRIALAGVLESQADEVSAAYEPQFDMALEAAEEGWVLLSGVRQ